VVPPRTQRIYSNAGYALAADALEQATGMDYRMYITESVLIPLEMEQTTFGVGVDDANVLSVKEPGLLGHDEQLFNGTRFRELGLPQSGAFGTASDYLQLLQMTLRHGRLSSDSHLLAPETADLLSTNQAGSLPGGVGDFMEWERCDWGAGFELRADKSPHWTGTALSAAAFTHFGASGTLAFADPATGTAAVILANRGTYTRWMLEPGGWPDICAALVA
jgi:CubicO group peptidase (beta-lactamase class C family)